jgi:hypothetical protein
MRILLALSIMLPLFAVEPQPISDLKEERDLTRMFSALKQKESEYQSAEIARTRKLDEVRQANDALGGLLQELRTKHGAAAGCTAVMNLEHDAKQLYSWKCPPEPAPTQASSDKIGQPSAVGAKVTTTPPKK